MVKTNQLKSQSYHLFINLYHDKELKRGLEQIINSIKNDFRIEISKNGKEFKDLSKWKGELINLSKQTGLFEKTIKEKKEYDLEVKKLGEKISKQEELIEDIKNNAIYRNSSRAEKHKWVKLGIGFIKTAKREGKKKTKTVAIIKSRNKSGGMYLRVARIRRKTLLSNRILS